MDRCCPILRRRKDRYVFPIMNLNPARRSQLRTCDKRQAIQAPDRLCRVITFFLSWHNEGDAEGRFAWMQYFIELGLVLDTTSGFRKEPDLLVCS